MTDDKVMIEWLEGGGSRDRVDCLGNCHV